MYIFNNAVVDGELNVKDMHIYYNGMTCECVLRHFEHTCFEKINLLIVQGP